MDETIHNLIDANNNIGLALSEAEYERLNNTGDISEIIEMIQEAIDALEDAKTELDFKN